MQGSCWAQTGGGIGRRGCPLGSPPLIAPPKTWFPACLPVTDELLQEQRADMEQFTASISETPVDVRVSSEESDEIPPFLPFHPFQSLPESEGVYGWQLRCWAGGGQKTEASFGSWAVKLCPWWKSGREGRQFTEPPYCRLRAGCLQHHHEGGVLLPLYRWFA